MRDDTATAIALRHYAAYNARDLDTYTAQFDEQIRVTVDGTLLTGRAAVTAFTTASWNALPTIRIATPRVLAEAPGTVMVAFHLEGTAQVTGSGGQPGLGRVVAGVTHQVIQVRDGLITAIISAYTPDAADRGDVYAMPTRSEAGAILREHAALRRVAELAARGVDTQGILDAVVVEASALLADAPVALMRYEPEHVARIVAGCRSRAPVGLAVASDGDTGTGEVLRTGRPVRTETFEGTTFEAMSRELGVTAAVAVPILVDGLVWGNLSTHTTEGTPPPHTEHRLAQFAELAAIAISGAQARGALETVVTEQSALRRVAELVARGASQDALLDAVAVEASGLIEGRPTSLMRFDDDAGACTLVATCGGPARVGLQTVVSPDDQGIIAKILRTGRPARVDDYAAVRGRAWARDDFGVGSCVAVPIVVRQRMWGVLGVTSPDRSMPPGAEERLEQFAELISASLAGAEARAELELLAREQSALRRVAERVARGDPPAQLFAAVASEASAVLGGEPMTLTRYENEQELSVVASSGGPAPVGTRITFAPSTQPDIVLRQGRAVRIDDYRVERDAELAEQYGLAASVSAPVAVEGRVWGALTATSPTRPLPAGTEHRLQQFADLIAFAVANAEKSAQLTASRARVVATADETRQRLQRDVHDGAQQQLVQTVVTLKLARESFAAGDGVAAAAYAAEALAHAERASSGLREIVRGILPASLTRGGLRAGVESLVDDLPLRVMTDVRVPRLGADIETTAYFVVAEAVTNLVKHARASQAWVRAAVEDGALAVEVRDDGVGGAQAGRGSGLTGLFDRVEARGGTLSILSPLGAGTAVRLSLPLDAGVAPRSRT